jgi:signal peptidase II
MQKNSKLLYLLITLTFLVGVNSYFSNLIASKLTKGWIYTGGLVNFVFEKNTGAAFSLLQDSTRLLVAISIISVFFIIYYIVRNIESLRVSEIFCASILLAGILGNLYERIFFGYVRDFFNLTFINFPVFNISDVFINIGVFAIIILILTTKRPIKLL